MRASAVFVLFTAPIALAGCYHDRHSALGSAIDDAESSVRYSPAVGQQPIYARPPTVHPPPKEEKPTATIYERLAGDPRFTNITKALDFVDDVGTLLNSTSVNLTFFAVPDWALHRRKPKHDHEHKLNWASIDALSIAEAATGAHPLANIGNLGQALELLDELEISTSDEDDKDKEKRKKIIKFILRAILEYHIIPTDNYPIVRLGLNTTFPTNLSFAGAFDGQPLRLRIDHVVLPPLTTVNFFSKVVHPDVPATNGIIHVINRPLFPPPSIFQELYLVSKYFSTFTSAIQRSELTEALDLKYTKEDGLTGTSLLTVFAPTNKAFDNLPPKLRFFLFSPFGARVLKKLLAYHIVPDVAVFSDYVHHVKAHTEPDVVAEAGHTLSENFPWYRKLDLNARFSYNWDKPRVWRYNTTLETLFTNHTIDALFEKTQFIFPAPPGHDKPFKIVTKVFANHQLAKIPDLIGLNGAIHVIDRILDPRKHAVPPGAPGAPGGGHHGHHGHRHEGEELQADNTWEDWEEWLPQWGEQ